MLRLLRTKLLHRATAISPCLLRYQLPKTNSAAAAAAAAAIPSLTLHFLQKSCGLSPEAAAAAAEEVQLKTTNNADAVVALLGEYGFSRPHIAALVSRHPRILLSRPGRTLKPKLDFCLAELGLPEDHLPKFLSTCPVLLLSSVGNRLAPNLAFLRSIVGDDGKLVRLIRKWARLLTLDIPSVLLPRIEALRSYGATDAVILTLLNDYPAAFTESFFVDTFDRIKRMPIRPSMITFAHAFGVLNKLPKPVWERRLANYRSLGWSEQQVLHAFVRHPFCMSASSDKVRRNMEFFTEKLTWGPDYVSMTPVVLSLSLGERILPRCLVLAILASKGLVNGRVNTKQLTIGRDAFRKKYVMKYQDELPELFEALKDKKKLEFQGFEVDLTKLMEAV